MSTHLRLAGSPPKRSAIAIAAHPDDIEFYMAGTLLLLKAAGYAIHYLNVASGNCGSLDYNSVRARVIRRAEGKEAARILGAEFHESFADDVEILYNVKLLRRLAAVIREVRPAIVLTHSPQDYMDDHTITCRLAVTAAFTRGMPNFRTTPSRPAADYETTVYHGMPHGLRDMLRRRIRAGAYVNTSSVHERKHRALAAHQSQQHWLDKSQGMNSYLLAMETASLEVGKLSKKFKHAEGWRRHLHFGFCAANADPLRDALGKNCLINQAYERDLERPCG
jgi:LmbE family N-acetylglucosaminyl deacetylase